MQARQDMVKLEVPRAFAKWVKPLLKFWQEKMAGSIEFHKTRGENIPLKVYPKPAYLDEDVEEYSA